MGKHVKWHHLTQQLTYQKRIREKKLQQQIQQAKREANQFLDNVEKCHIHNLIEEKRQNKLNKRAHRTESSAETANSPAPNSDAQLKAIKRNFRQKKQLKGDEDEAIDDTVMSEASRRKGRTSMPSWDEIVFGARTEDG